MSDRLTLEQDAEILCNTCFQPIHPDSPRDYMGDSMRHRNRADCLWPLKAKIDFLRAELAAKDAEIERLKTVIKADWPDPDADEPPATLEQETAEKAEFQEWLAARSAPQRKIKRLEAECAAMREALQNLAYYAARISPPPYGHACRWCANCENIVKGEARHILASTTAGADLLARLKAAEQRESALDHQITLIKQRLQQGLRDLHYIPDSDRSGHPHGYSVMQIPDWEAKQMLDAIEAAIKEEGK